MIRYLLLSIIFIPFCTFATESKIERYVDNVFDVGNEIPIELRYFTQIMGASTLVDAKNRFNCLRSTNPSIPAAIVHYPNPPFGVEATPPMVARHRFPYSVVVASYATDMEAHESLYWVRGKINFSSLFKCLHFDDKEDAKSVLDGQSYVYELRVERQSWPRLIERTPLASFDGVGYIKSQHTGMSKSFSALIKRKIYTNVEEVRAELASIRSMYSEVNFSAIRQGDYYYLASASNVKGSTLDEAISQMRKRGLYEYTYLAEISSDVEISKVQSAPKIIGLFSQRSSFDIEPKLETAKSSLSISVLEMQDLLVPVQERVRSCFEKLKPRVESKESSIEVGISIEEFSACSGIVLDNKDITKCILESDCIGLRVPLNFNISPNELVRQCLEGKSDLCSGTLLDPFLQKAFKQFDGAKCIDSYESDDCKAALALLKNICGGSENAEACAKYPALMSNLPKRFNDVIRCARESHCQDIVPRAPDIRIKIADEIERTRKASEDLVRPVKEGLAMLSKSKDELVSAFKACQDLASSNEKEKANVCFAKLALTPGELEALQCFSVSDNLNNATCLLKDKKIEDIVSRARCLNEAGTDISKMAECSGIPDAAVLHDKYECATREADPLKIILNCSDSIPPEVTAAIRCIESSSNVEAKLEACLPEHAKDLKTAHCVATSQSDVERLACLNDAIPMDPTAKKTLACAISANGDAQAAASCALGELVPGDLGKALACGTKSTGAVDFALCVAGPQMNAELRMAAECAASTGGEPISFATCTAGRLTVAELTKCLSGQIGQEGGCFGPNNTIVKTLNNVINDLTHGLGEENEIVKGFRELKNLAGAITAPLEEFGRNIGRELENLGDNYNRSDLGKLTCSVFNCG